MADQLRVLRVGLEKKLQHETRSSKCIVELARETRSLYSRFARRASGQTAFQKVRTQCHWSGCPVEWLCAGKICSSRSSLRGGRRLHTRDAQWFSGVWMSPSLLSDENLLVTTDGLMTCRTARCLEPDRRVPNEILQSVRGLPWDDETGPRRGRPSAVRQEHAAPRGTSQHLTSLETLNNRRQAAHQMMST